MKISWFVFLLVFFIMVPATSADLQVYKTWAPWETDSFLAAWALKRYVHPEARFAALPRGTKIKPGTAIDVPDSPYRRNATRTAFEEVVRIHHLNIPCFMRIRSMARLLEMSPWRKSENREAVDFEFGLRPLLPKTPVEGGLEAAFEYVDGFCKSSSDGEEK